MKKTLLFLAVFLYTVTLHASHFSGGELRYEYNGTNYTLYLALYKSCDIGGSPALPSAATVNIKSATAGASFNVTLNAVGFDSVGLGCPPGINTCTVPASVIPGYIVGKYSASVTFPSAQTDWVMSYIVGARANSINLNSPTSLNFYLESLLNNSTAINSSPWIPNKPNYYMTVNQTMFVPLQTLDAEGDSTAYELVPAQSAAGTNVSYATGFSATSPFGTGGQCFINANRTLVLKGATQGAFVVTIKVKDYRNGVLVGTYIREIMCYVFAGTTTFTFPMATPSSVFTVYTCPGQSSGITVNFEDSTATDSVYLTVTPPTIPGWTFTPTVTNGLATGSVNVTWTTPSGLNPATLPFFYIHIRARDNGCPKAISDFSILVRTRQCLADSVWPGDANGDFTVNIYDPLAIAIANGKTGPTRTGATTSWTAQACTNWGSTFVTNNTDIKHADCNGDGTVNTTDLAAVTSNWGQWHLKGGSNQKTTGAPELYFDLTGVKLEAGKQVAIPVMIGTQNVKVSEFYGLATVINIGIPLTDRPTIDITSSWLGSINMMNFTHSTVNDELHWAYSRMDQTNAAGFGKVGTLNFTVPATMKPGDNVTLRFSMTRVIDKNGKEHSINTPEAVGTVATTSVRDIDLPVRGLTVVPNPSGSEADLRFDLTRNSSVDICITDVVGKTIWQYNGTYAQGEQKIGLPGNLSAGMYIIRVTTDQSEPQSVKWIRE